MDEVPAYAGPIRVVDLAALGRDHRVVDLTRAEVAEGLDNDAAFPPGGGHVRGVVYRRVISRLPIFTCGRDRR